VVGELRVAAAIFAGLRLVLPASTRLFSRCRSLRIGAYAAWLALRAPSAPPCQGARGDRRHGMGRLPQRVEAGYSREGYEVRRLAGEDADLELAKAAHVARRVPALARRPDRHRAAAPASRRRRKRDAHECSISASARSPATRSPLR